MIQNLISEIISYMSHFKFKSNYIKINYNANSFLCNLILNLTYK